MSIFIFIYVNRPFRATCECCGKQVTTYVKQEYNIFIVLLVITSFVVFGFFYGSLLILVFFPLFQNVTHFCPICLTLLYENYFYPIKKKENFFMIQYGKCVMVIKAIYIYSILLIIVLLGIGVNVKYYYFTVRTNVDNELLNSQMQSNDFIGNLYDKNAELTWDELLKDCGASVMVDNSARAIEIFNRKYFKKSVNWKGYFIDAFIQRLRPFEQSTDQLVNLNIRMIPSETMKGQDLVLSMDITKYHRLLPVLQRLKTGTPIQFKAIFESVGDEWKPHHLHLEDLSITADFLPEDKKVVLFKGINFDISGHMKLQSKVKEVMEGIEEKK